VESAKYFNPPPALVRGVGVTLPESGDSALYDSDGNADASGNIDSGADLALRISEALRAIGLFVKPEEDQIISAVSGLCDIVKVLELPWDEEPDPEPQDAEPDPEPQDVEPDTETDGHPAITE
jgi:hypothetical protein